jgi:membrane protein
MLRELAGPLRKFQSDRGTHLAAMVAYYALVAFVPILFLLLAALGLLERVDESSAVVRELKRLLPGAPVEKIVGAVSAIQENAATLGVVGGAFLLWSALGLFGALESAFNIVYERPNRPFFRGKLVASAFLTASLAASFAGLATTTVGWRALRDWAPSVAGNAVVAVVVSVLGTSAVVFVFLVAAYLLLTNERQRLREVLPGALFATTLLQATFQVLPLFIILSSESVALQTLGSTALLLVWLYVMANVIVLGAEVNWWLRRDRRGDGVAGLA